MFTGLVEDVGEVAAIDAGADGAKLVIATELADQVAPGDSVAVAGVCLTAAEVGDGRFSADAINETLSRTSLGSLARGDAVNLELAMKADGRFGGHIVQGHVDGAGSVAAVRADGDSTIVTIAAAPELIRYVVEKGSITIDGVSLTVARVDAGGFDVALIPETLTRTTLGAVTEGAAVNIEIDIFAKYAEKLAVTR